MNKHSMFALIICMIPSVAYAMTDDFQERINSFRAQKLKKIWVIDSTKYTDPTSPEVIAAQQAREKAIRDAREKAMQDALEEARRAAREAYERVEQEQLEYQRLLAHQRFIQMSAAWPTSNAESHTGGIPSENY